MTMAEREIDTVAVEGPFESFLNPAVHIARHILIDRQRGIITVDDQTLPWEITSDVRVGDLEPMRTVTMTIICSSVTLAADYAIILGGLYLPWRITETGPRVTGYHDGPRYLVTVELLTDRVTEITEPAAIENVIDAEVVDGDE